MAELKTKTLIEVLKNEKKYVFECYSDSPLGEIFDVLCEMQTYVVNRIQDSQPKVVDKVDNISEE